MAINASCKYGGGESWASGEWDDICSPLAAVSAWFDQAQPPCAGAPAVAVANHKSSKFDYEDLGAGGWATARAGDDVAESGSEGGCGDAFSDVWCAAAMPLPISPLPVPFSSAARQAQQATLKASAEDTDASQAPSRVASPALGTCRARVVPAVIIADGDAKEGRGAPARARASRVSAFDLEAVDEKTRRRLIKNRASAERSRMQRKAKMQELELRCEQQEQEIQRLRAQLEGVAKHLSREGLPPLV